MCAPYHFNTSFRFCKCICRYAPTLSALTWLDFFMCLVYFCQSVAIVIMISTVAIWRRKQVCYLLPSLILQSARALIYILSNIVPIVSFVLTLIHNLLLKQATPASTDQIVCINTCDSTPNPASTDHIIDGSQHSDNNLQSGMV